MPSLTNPQPQPPDVRPRTSSVLDVLTQPVLVWVVFSILAMLVWVPRLFRSFWVDEAGTFWMAHGGLIAAVQKTSHWPGQSLLYSAIASLFCINGGPIREFLLRVPSVLGIAAAACFLYKLAEDAIGRGAGLVAVILLAFHPEIVILGTEARPYALAIGAVAASSWCLYRFVDGGRRAYLGGYMAASLLVIYLHYLFGMIFVCHAAYLLYVLLFGRRRVRWLEVIAAYVGIGVLSLPLLPHVKLLLHEAHTLPMAISPAIGDLIEFLITPFLFFGAFLAAIVWQFLAPASLRPPSPLERPLTVLALLWWLLGPVLFFAVSIASPMPVFVPRYTSYAVVAQVLLLAYIGWAVFESRAARLWAILAVLLSTASPLSIAAYRKPGAEELRPFMRIIRSESAKGALPPVFFCSPLPESNFYNWRGGVNASYLYAPFVAYPVPNPVMTLPYRLTEEVKQHVQHVISTELADKPEVLFITHDTLLNSWAPWMIEAMAKAGFSSKLEHPNSYAVIIFRRANS